MKSFIVTLTSVSTLNFLATMLPQNDLAPLNLAIGCVTFGLALGLGIGCVVGFVCDCCTDSK